MSNQSDTVTELPQTILDYFAAANEGRVDDATACFAEDARVHDEKLDHVGHVGIRKWVADTTREFQPKTQLLRAVEREGVIAATANVSGNFPGSPVDLVFSFTLADGKIARLSIQ